MQERMIVICELKRPALREHFVPPRILTSLLLREFCHTLQCFAVPSPEEMQASLSITLGAAAATECGEFFGDCP
jgi:hypothetical protein